MLMLLTGIFSPRPPYVSIIDPAIRSTGARVPHDDQGVRVGCIVFTRNTFRSMLPRLPSFSLSPLHISKSPIIECAFLPNFTAGITWCQRFQLWLGFLQNGIQVRVPQVLVGVGIQQQAPRHVLGNNKQPPVVPRQTCKGEVLHLVAALREGYSQSLGLCCVHLRRTFSLSG